MSDVDAGPVIGGYGVAASAFGVGAARVMGRTDQAYKLAAQALAVTWPLPDGTLLTPRILSNISDAPYLGESATLFALTRRNLAPLRGESHASPPASVYVGLGVLLGLGAFEVLWTLRTLCRWRRGGQRFYTPQPQFQVVVWSVLMLGVFVLWRMSCNLAGLVLLLAALTLPLQRRRAETASPACESAR